MQAYDNSYPTYYRTSRDVNAKSQNVSLGKANVIKTGDAATIIAVGPLLDMVLEATKEIDVTVIYYTSIVPFDSEVLKKYSSSGKILVCEPFYTGGLLEDITLALPGDRLLIEEIGIPHVFPSHYGYTRDHYSDFGITIEGIRNKVTEMINK